MKCIRKRSHRDVPEALAAGPSLDDDGATTILDYDRVLSAGQRARLEGTIGALQEDTGWKVRVVTRFGNQLEVMEQP
jgi:uncharacterized membrane protein YgcG